MPLVGDDHGLLRRIGARLPDIAGDADDLAIDARNNRLSVVVIDIEEPVRLSLLVPWSAT